jgi:hypothetical protein
MVAEAATSEYAVTRPQCDKCVVVACGGSSRSLRDKKRQLHSGAGNRRGAHLPARLLCRACRVFQSVSCRLCGGVFAFHAQQTDFTHAEADEYRNLRNLRSCHIPDRHRLVEVDRMREAASKLSQITRNRSSVETSA